MASAFVFALLCGSAAWGQTAATVSGTLTDSLTGAPIPGAIVVLESPALTRQTKSGSDGRFSLQAPPGSYHLVVRADRYISSRAEMTLAPTGAASDIRLDPELHFTEVVSVSPQSRNQFDAYQPTNVLGGQELTKELQATLGATVENEPGVALRSFGPGPARPVIRGLDGDRVLVLEDGQRMGDLSSQSGDHGVNVNPASASRN